MLLVVFLNFVDGPMAESPLSSFERVSFLLDRLTLKMATAKSPGAMPESSL